jgi:cyanobactin maturation PatA/PatG family protease
MNRSTQSNPPPFWSDLDFLWAETTGDSQIVVAVLDGPVDLSHPCFHGADLCILQSLVSGVPNTGAAARHGTHVASILFGGHDTSVRGVAPMCRGLVVPVFDDTDQDSIAPCSQLDLARAIMQAVDSGAHIINISAGQSEPSGEPHALLAQAIQVCRDRNVLIIAPTGNDGCDCLHVPAAVPSVLAVGAMDLNGVPLDTSNWGSVYGSNGVLAPGLRVKGAVPGGKATTEADGTSCATALVSGVAALLLSLQLKSGQGPDPMAVKSTILGTAVPCDKHSKDECSRLLAGIINVGGAMDEIRNEGGKVCNALDIERIRETEVIQADRAQVHAATSTDSTPHSASERPTQTASIPHAHVETRSNPSPELAFRSSSVSPSTCNCDSRDTECQCAAGAKCQCAAGSTLVYPLGQLGFDFGTEARRDSFRQQAGDEVNSGNPGPLLSYLDSNPADAAAILWTLDLDETPIYAIQGQGPFGSHIYERLREFLKAQIDPGELVERVSVPGNIMGSVRLMSGQVLPVISPELRGMSSWTTAALVDAVVGPPPAKGSSGRKVENHEAKVRGVRSFLEKVYHESRNLGVASQDRAINFAATNAFNVAGIFESALKEALDLDTIEVERSPISRAESDCWDVKLTFFNPRRIFEEARRVYRYTVDVSDVVPVTVGSVRSWSVR